MYNKGQIYKLPTKSTFSILVDEREMYNKLSSPQQHHILDMFLLLNFVFYSYMDRRLFLPFVHPEVTTCNPTGITVKHTVPPFNWLTLIIGQRIKNLGV